MRSDIDLALRQKIRDELAELRELHASRRAASSRLPALRRTGPDRLRPLLAAPVLAASVAIVEPTEAEG
jgi:hypothetical protein